MTATLVPAVVKDVGGVVYIAWTISLYQLGAVVIGTATAAQCRRFGVKHVLLFAAGSYALGCAIAAAAPTMSVLLAARLIQGSGRGALIALSHVAIQQSFPEQLWGRLFGLTSVIWGAGSLLGPLIGGVFASHDAWRLAFWFFAAQAGLLCVLSWPLEFGHQADIPSGRPPMLTVLILLAGVALIACAEALPGQSLPALMCLTGSGGLVAAGLVDRRSRERLLPIQALDLRPPIGTGLLTAFTLSAATTGLWAYGPLLLDALFGTRPLISGGLLACEALSWSAASIVISGLPASAGRNFIRSGVIMIVAGATGFALVVPAGSLVGIMGCCLLQDVGFGVCWPSIIRRVIQYADEGERILAAAAPGTMQRVGYAVGASFAGVAANIFGLENGTAVKAAREAGFWVSAAFIPVLGIGLISGWCFTSVASSWRSI